LTGTFSVALKSSGNRSYVTTYTISSANTWTQISLTVAGDTSTTWLTTNGVGMNIWWNFGAGSTYTTSSSNSWQSADYQNITGSVQVVGTSGATFYITGVQLEKGSTATSFDYRHFGAELTLCQRYYEIVVDATYYSNTFIVGRMDSASSALGSFVLRVIKRASPTYTTSGSATVYYNSTSSSVSGANFSPSGSIGGGRIQFLSLTSGARDTGIHADIGAGCSVTASAEL
jgi:hypothetical protein